MKLPRLSVSWFSLPEIFRRYWDQAMTAVEGVTITSTVTNLPTTGNRGIVSDAANNTFLDIVVGGGSNTVPVFYDGTNWRIG